MKTVDSMGENFPFYYWYINISNNLCWLNCLILITIQKIIPFYLIHNLFKKTLKINYFSNIIIINNIIINNYKHHHLKVSN